MVLESTSREAFQAFWIEIILDPKKNIVCGILVDNAILRNLFKYTLMKLSKNGQKYILHDRPFYIMGDSNIDLLKSQSSSVSQRFLMSAQSFHLIPTIDKPTRVHNTSATLIDNIFTNDLEQFFVSGNIVSDLTVPFSKFCISRRPTSRVLSVSPKVQDYCKSFYLKILLMISLKSIGTLLL